MYVDDVIAEIREKYEEQPEFVQSVEEVFNSVRPLLEAHPEYEEADLLRRMAEPERMFRFRVVWSDDQGRVQTNVGYRCQFTEE